MVKPILKDKDQYPDSNVLKEALKENYKTFQQMEQSISQEPYNLVGEWRYYNDGKAWLYKANYKKKTVFWLTVISTAFIVTFYFNEKNNQGVFSLPIEESLKENLKNAKPIGKLLPLQIEVSNSDPIEDILTLVDYKKKA